jgi:hypothetical protein
MMELVEMSGWVAERLPGGSTMSFLTSSARDAAMPAVTNVTATAALANHRNGDRTERMSPDIEKAPETPGKRS